MLSFYLGGVGCFLLIMASVADQEDAKLLINTTGSTKAWLGIILLALIWPIVPFLIKYYG